jgi:hypothetical protein
MNDWPDRETVAFVRRCAEAALPRGRVVTLGGGHRTITEFRSMAAEADLTIVAAAHQPSGRFTVGRAPVASRNH